LLTIPEEALNHPDFKKLNKDEAVDIFIKFDYPLENEICLVAKQIVEIWFADLNQQLTLKKVLPLFAYQIEPESLRIVLAHVKNPNSFLENLLIEYLKSPLDVTELFVRKRKFQINHHNKIKLEKLIPDSRLASLVEGNAGSLSEYRNLLKVNLRKQTKTPKVERLANLYECPVYPFYLENLIVRYGLKKGTKVSNSLYASKLAFYISKQLEDTFGAHLKVNKENMAAEVKSMQTIVKNERLGYQFSVDYFDFYSVYGKQYRMRDYELFQIIREITQTFRLAPVAHWERNSQQYTIQLWANWTY